MRIMAHLEAQDQQWRRERQQCRSMLKESPCSEPKRAPKSITEKELEADVQAPREHLRHGMTKKDREMYQRLLRKQKMLKWTSFLSLDEDFDYDYIFRVLQFKIDRCAGYWRQFSHLENGDYIRGQMELASRLLQIIIENGNENKDKDSLPSRVNLRNKNRFCVRWCYPDEAFHLGTEQAVRFKKAYCLFFKLLNDNILHWWD